MPDSLAIIRRKIDAIDARVVKLLAARAGVAPFVPLLPASSHAVLQLVGGFLTLIFAFLAHGVPHLLGALLGLAWGDVSRAQYLSIWPLADALTVAWSLLFPNRTILFMFVLPAASASAMLEISIGLPRAPPW